MQNKKDNIFAIQIKCLNYIRTKENWKRFPSPAQCIKKKWEKYQRCNHKMKIVWHHNTIMNFYHHHAATFHDNWLTTNWKKKNIQNEWTLCKFFFFLSLNSGTTIVIRWMVSHLILFRIFISFPGRKPWIGKKKSNETESIENNWIVDMKMQVSPLVYAWIVTDDTGYQKTHLKLCTMAVMF